jgi:hypothetical protein
MPEKTDQERMLDTRPARDDLTSRECSKLIGGLIEGLVRVFGPATVHGIVHYYASTDAIWDVRRAMKSGATLADANDLVERAMLARAKAVKNAVAGRCEVIFGSMTGALGHEMAELDNVRAAIRWWDERADVAWEMIGQLPRAKA